MIPSVKKPGGNTRGLLAYLYGPGRHDEHLDPHVVASFSALGLPDPGRDQDATLTQLRDVLDAPVKLRNEGFGKSVTDHVWHCPVRTAPGDRYLSDAEWGEIARRIVARRRHRPGRRPARLPVDRGAPCRRPHPHPGHHRPRRRPPTQDPQLRHARPGTKPASSRRNYGLHQVAPGDRTGDRLPTQAEMHKADRLGWEQTSREWLQERIRAAIPHAASVDELLAYLEADGVEVKVSRYPSGDLLGYAVGRPGDLKADGRAGLHLRQQDRPRPVPAQTPGQAGHRDPPGPPDRTPQPSRRPAGSAPPTHSTPSTTTSPALPTASSRRARSPPSARSSTPPPTPRPSHCGPNCVPPAPRSPAPSAHSIRADHHAATGLRHAARDIVHAATSPDGSTLDVLLTALVWSVILAARWHQAQGHRQQAEAARATVTHLQTAYDHAAADHLTALTNRQPTLEITNTLAGEVRTAIPDHADRILTDPNWPALAAVLADAHAAGHRARTLLTEAAARRELHTARLPAQVLLGRIQHTARNPAPNPRAEAARLRSHNAGNIPRTGPQPAAAASATIESRQHRGR